MGQRCLGASFAAVSFCVVSGKGALRCETRVQVKLDSQTGPFWGLGRVPHAGAEPGRERQRSERIPTFSEDEMAEGGRGNMHDNLRQ